MLYCLSIVPDTMLDLLDLLGFKINHLRSVSSRIDVKVERLWRLSWSRNELRGIGHDDAATSLDTVTSTTIERG